MLRGPVFAGLVSVLGWLVVRRMATSRQASPSPSRFRVLSWNLLAAPYTKYISCFSVALNKHSFLLLRYNSKHHRSGTKQESVQQTRARSAPLARFSDIEMRDNNISLRALGTACRQPESLRCCPTLCFCKKLSHPSSRPQSTPKAPGCLLSTLSFRAMES